MTLVWFPHPVTKPDQNTPKHGQRSRLNPKVCAVYEISYARDKVLMASQHLYGKSHTAE